ncbi:MAG: S4 domain-containing protein [Candidatus Acidiferrales bacterium]
MLERLQKIIARAGIASRRHAEEFITSGLVTVNGQTVTELGSKADASRDHIKVSGKLLRPASASNLVYLILNKPPEVVSTMSDPEGRPSLRDLLHGVSERVFPVGRLEYHSTGLVLLTNDGDLANRILQSNDLRQTYQLKLKTLLTFAEIESLARATGAHITRLRGKEMPWYEVTLSEARRDALRNKLFQTGHPVDKMRRVGMGNLKLAKRQRQPTGRPSARRSRQSSRSSPSLRNPQSSPGPQGPRSLQSWQSPHGPASSRSTSSVVPQRSFGPTPRPSSKPPGEQISTKFRLGFEPRCDMIRGLERGIGSSYVRVIRQLLQGFLSW